MAAVPLPSEVDVLIIGGGLSGLSAALKLKDEAGSTPLSYLVLEGNPRLGGRTLTRGQDRDFGAAYVGASQHHVQHLLRRFQLPMRRVFLPGTHQWLFQNSRAEIQRLPGNDPTALPGGLNALLKLFQLDTLALELRDHLHAPERSRLAAYDAMSVADWISEQRAAWEAAGGRDDVGMSPATEDAFVSSVRSTFSVQPAELSFFFLLYYAATAGGYSALVAVAGSEGAEDLRFAGGTQALLSALQTEVGEHNIQLETHVTKLTYDAHGVTAETTAGAIRAKRVVVAMSPAHSAKISLVPATPELHPEERAQREALCSAMASCMGRTIKGFVHFKEPCWRSQQLMGYSVSVAAPFQQYPLAWTLDNVWDSPADPTTKPHYTLMTFIVADAAAYWTAQPLRARARAVLEQLRTLYGFGDDALLNPSDPEANYEDENWPAQLGSGLPAPGAMMPPNTLSRFGSALRTPIGPIHFAGSESATDWCGYMSGAIQSGFRAATEVLAALGE